MDASSNGRQVEGGEPTQNFQSSSSPSGDRESSNSTNYEGSASAFLPQRLSHQPSVASPLRTAIQSSSPSIGFDDNTPTPSPSTSTVALHSRPSSEDYKSRPSGGMQRARSHLDQSSGESSGSGSGSVTPTTHALPLHHHPYQMPSSSSIEQRRHSDTDHLSVHMSGTSSASQWPGIIASSQQSSRFVPHGTTESLESRRGYADALAPVNVLVGVLTTDSKYERRNIIRQTYACHTLPLDLQGNPSSNVQVKFILGKVRKSHARRVALEMETFNDIVVLDMEETQSARKTLGFMKWATENATVPFLRPVGPDWSNLNTVVPNPALPGGLSSADADSDVGKDGKQRYQLAWKKVDYIVKADDDSFIVLDELERHLRVAPRKMTYWGYLIKNWFMGGEAYALSFDLVEWMAQSPEVGRSAKGKEDTRTPQWIAMHPNRSSINWVSEHCWIYDHPKGGSPYSHGFLFPDYVEKIKLEARRGLSEQEIAYRGGERASQSYSTVTKWHQKYVGPRRDLTIEEEVEALIEGGGRWAGTWVRNSDGSEGESWMPYDDIVYNSDDSRLSPSTNGKGGPVLAEDAGWEPSSGLHIYGRVQLDNISLNVSEPKSTVKRRDLLSDLTDLPNQLLGDQDNPPSHMAQAAPVHSLRQSSHNGIQRPHLLPRPSHKDGKGEYAALRAQRYLNKPHGGTVVVHYLKKTEWWLETALALSGKPKMWTNGAGRLGKEWRMGGSPLVRSDGYIFQGRSQPRPVEEGVAPAEEAYTLTRETVSTGHSKHVEKQQQQQQQQPQTQQGQDQQQTKQTSPDARWGSGDISQR